VPAANQVDLGYRPRAAFLPYHTSPKRWACIVAHRRAGKTIATINHLIDRAIRAMGQDPRFAYVAPTFAQAKDIAWTYLKRYTGPIPGVQASETELRVDLPNGARVRLYGADNYDRMRGIYLDGVVLDEFADMDPRAWSEVIRPALADRGGWATFIGTPKGRNAFYDLYERAQTDPTWMALRLKASATGLIPPGELQALRAELTEDEYLREFETSFDAAIQGAYYAQQLAQAEAAGRIGRVPYDPAAEVHCAFDLGIQDATAIWLAQFIGREIRLIDYIENNGVALDWYARELKQKPYAYAPLILPHDAMARELGTGKSRADMLRSLKFNVRIAPRLPVADGIEAVRRMLPRCWIDKDACHAGLTALRDYREKTDLKRKISYGPLHDWTSHGADALRYLMTAYEEPQAKDAKRKERHALSWLG
jgi:hypothetical protein